MLLLYLVQKGQMVPCCWNLVGVAHALWRVFHKLLRMGRGVVAGSLCSTCLKKAWDFNVGEVWLPESELARHGEEGVVCVCGGNEEAVCRCG